MKKLVIAALGAYGLWYFAAPYATAARVLGWAHKHPDQTVAVDAYYVIGWRYYADGDYPKAQETLGIFVADFPAGPHTERALLHLADAAQQNRDFQAARDALDRFLKDYPDSPERTLAQHRRDELNGL